MSLRIEEWIERMRLARNPGPVVRITAARNTREMGWTFEVDDDTDIAELAERIENSTRNAGLVSCELRAYDAQGRFMEPLLHKPEATQIVQQVGSGASLALQMGVEASVAASLKSNRDFTELGLESMKHGYQIAERAMKRLEEENAALRQENERLRLKISDLWDVMEKLNTHEVETKHQTLKLEHMGRMGAMITDAVMRRLIGGGAAAQTLDQQMAHTLFRSLASDIERVQQIIPFLTDAEKLAVMELIRNATAPASGPPSANGESKVNGTGAASAAAAANAANVSGMGGSG